MTGCRMAWRSQSDTTRNSSGATRVSHIASIGPCAAPVCIISDPADTTADIRDR